MERGEKGEIEEWRGKRGRGRQRSDSQEYCGVHIEEEWERGREKMMTGARRDLLA